MRGSASSARAIATRWRWPPESVNPRSPTSVSSPSGRSSSRPSSPARTAAAASLVVACLRARVGDVVAQRGGEQEGVVGHDGNLASQRGRVDLAHIGAVDEDGALVHVIEARDQHHERGLARAGRTDDRDRGPGLHLEVDTAQHRLVTVVGERHVAQLHAPAAGGQRRGVRDGGEARRASSSSKTRSPLATARWAIPSAMPSIRTGEVSISTYP